MAKEQTVKSRYPSAYSPKQYVTGAQYIIEIICEKRAAMLNKTLTVKFWQNEEWAEFFKSQLRMCHKLLKTYDEKAILNALYDNRTKTVNSLFAPWLLPIIKEEQKKINLAKKQIQEVVVERHTTTSKPRETITNKKFKQLMDLDNG